MLALPDFDNVTAIELALNKNLEEINCFENVNTDNSYDGNPFIIYEKTQVGCIAWKHGTFRFQRLQNTGHSETGLQLYLQCCIVKFCDQKLV